MQLTLLSSSASLPQTRASCVTIPCSSSCRYTVHYVCHTRTVHYVCHTMTVHQMCHTLTVQALCTNGMTPCSTSFMFYIILLYIFIYFCDTDRANAKHALLVRHHTAGATDIGTYVYPLAYVTYVYPLNMCMSVWTMHHTACCWLAPCWCVTHHAACPVDTGVHDLLWPSCGCPLHVWWRGPLLSQGPLRQWPLLARHQRGLRECCTLACRGIHFPAALKSITSCLPWIRT
jgi:hypothetical protein